MRKTGRLIAHGEEFMGHVLRSMFGGWVVFTGDEYDKELLTGQSAPDSDTRDAAASGQPGPLPLTAESLVHLLGTRAGGCPSFAPSPRSRAIRL